MDDEIACIPFHCQISYTFDMSCWFHATKADIVFFGDPDMLVDTECTEFGAGIWSMRGVFAVQAFVPLLVGCVDLKRID